MGIFDSKRYRKIMVQKFPQRNLVQKLVVQKISCRKTQWQFGRRFWLVSSFRAHALIHHDFPVALNASNNNWNLLRLVVADVVCIIKYNCNFPAPLGILSPDLTPRPVQTNKKPDNYTLAAIKGEMQILVITFHFFLHDGLSSLSFIDFCFTFQFSLIFLPLQLRSQFNGVVSTAFLLRWLVSICLDFPTFLQWRVKPNQIN